MAVCSVTTREAHSKGTDAMVNETQRSPVDSKIPAEIDGTRGKAAAGNGTLSEAELEKASGGINPQPLPPRHDRF
jgi:hypothetical protein